MGTIGANPHPCQKCGACCAQFQVTFDSQETDLEQFNVPKTMVVPLSPEKMALKFQNQNCRRCLALKGTIGHNVGCAIYENRPSPCRNFKASFENGIHQPRCDAARMKMGFSPLTEKDFLPREDFDVSF